jgi:hypothetical protein
MTATANVRIPVIAGGDGQSTNMRHRKFILEAIG